MAIHENTEDYCLDMAATLNSRNECRSYDFDSLRQAGHYHRSLQKTITSIIDSGAKLFSAAPYFISKRQMDQMRYVIEGIESVVGLPAFKEAALSWAPDIANYDPGSRGVFYGYDFHYSGAHPKLIEINTNAGGALLNTLLGKAQKIYSGLENDTTPRQTAPEKRFVDMFKEEWKLKQADHDRPLSTIAIVDEDPHSQFLRPEFQLFEWLFNQHNLKAVIADPSMLHYRDGAMWYDSMRIDLIYNRLVDFPLQKPAHSHLKNAYLNGDVVVTPHPRAHALYADKRILSILTNSSLLQRWGVSKSVRSLLSEGIPKTTIVEPAHAQQLWNKRKSLFFKPFAGYGGKATYRGDKITKKVWAQIMEGNYVAQELVPPPERNLFLDGNPTPLKVDLRHYVYDGKVQLVAARMYQGQTTNFRTTGGGFAPVFQISEQQVHAYQSARRGMPLSKSGSLSLNPYHLHTHGGSAINQ